VYIHTFLQVRCKSGWSCDHPGLHVEPPMIIIKLYISFRMHGYFI